MKVVCAVALTAMMMVPAIADEAVKEKKSKGKTGRGGDIAKVMIMQLEKVGLTEEQTAKITEMGKSVVAAITELHSSAGITKETMQKLGESRKTLRESGKKGKELMQAVNEAAGLSEAQVAAMKTANGKQMAFQKEVVAMLSEEQIELLPKRFLKSGKGKGKGKKKGKNKDNE